MQDTQTQSGRIDGARLVLHNVALLHQSNELDEDTSSFLCRRLRSRKSCADVSNAELSQRALNSFRKDGYTGSEVAIVTARGLFFPQHEIPEGCQGRSKVFVATEITRFAKPGMIELPEADQYVPGMFIGNLDGITPQSISFKYAKN